MVVIVRPLANLVLELGNLCRLGPADEIRPATCLCCGTAAGIPGALNLIGHGTYRRQVLGASGPAHSVLIHVRRYLCLACRRTTSVLPDELHPRRWYGAVAIVTALALSLFDGMSANDIRGQLGGQSETRRWRTLERWKGQLLWRLWPWRAAELGYADGEASHGAVDCATRLRRLLNLHGANDRSPPDEIVAAARAATANTAHTRTKSWPIGHGS